MLNDQIAWATEEYWDIASSNKVNIQSYLDMNNDKMKTFIESKNAEFWEWV